MIITQGTCEPAHSNGFGTVFKKCLGMQPCYHLPLGLLPECLSTHSFSPFTVTLQQVSFSNKNISIHIFHVERLMATLSPQAFYTSIINNSQGQAGYTSDSNSTHICIIHLNDTRDAWILGTRSQQWLSFVGSNLIFANSQSWICFLSLFLMPRISKWLPEFWKICELLEDNSF